MRCLTLLLLTLVVTACYSGGVGATCEDERDCARGLGCARVESLGGICTVRCGDGEACAAGTCAATELGDVCLRTCTSSSACERGQSCVAFLDGQRACWKASSETVELERLEIDRLVLREYTTLVSDGALNAGELVIVEAFLRNAGEAPVSGVLGSLELATAGASLSSCAVSAAGRPGQSCLDQAATHCACEAVEDAYARDYAVGAVDALPILSFALHADADVDAAAASLTLTLRGRDGRRWALPVAVPITRTDGIDLRIARIEVRDDTNGDNALSAGEAGTLAVWLENVGTASAVGLVPRLSAPSGFSFLWCSASSAEGSTSCGTSCDCLRAASERGQIIGPEVVASEPILFAGVSVDTETPAGTHLFALELRNAGGDTTTLDVAVEVLP